MAGPIIKAARGGHRELVQKTNFLSNRVVNPWKKLDDAKIQAPSTNSFENRVDGYYSSVELVQH